MTAPASAATASRRLARLMKALFFFRLSPFSLNRLSPFAGLPSCSGASGNCKQTLKAVHHISASSAETRHFQHRFQHASTCTALPSSDFPSFFSNLAFFADSLPLVGCTLPRFSAFRFLALALSSSAQSLVDICLPRHRMRLNSEDEDTIRGV